VPNGGAGVANFGTFNGTGTLTGSGPGFTGTLTGTTANGIFSGGFFGPEAAKALEQKLVDLGKDAQLVVHPNVEHAFFNDSRPEVHHPETADKAWAATLAFFRENIS